jgi:hypothetical protein
MHTDKGRRRSSAAFDSGSEKLNGKRGKKVAPPTILAGGRLSANGARTPGKSADSAESKAGIEPLLVPPSDQNETLSREPRNPWEFPDDVVSGENGATAAANNGGPVTESKALGSGESPAAEIKVGAGEATASDGGTAKVGEQNIGGDPSGGTGEESLGIPSSIIAASNQTNSVTTDPPTSESSGGASGDTNRLPEVKAGATSHTADVTPAGTTSTTEPPITGGEAITLGTVVAAAVDTMPTWSDKIEAVSPDVLSDHGLWEDIAGPATPEREEELADDVRDGHIGPEIVMITGDRCHSTPGTILRGTRYVHALTAARVRGVMVVRRTDLSADAEEVILIKAVLGGRHARRLKPSRLAVLVDRLYKVYEKGQGFRSDITDSTCVGGNASPDPAGDGDADAHHSRRPDTLSKVARAAREPRNAIANLRKTFGSHVSHLALRDGVDSEKIPLTIAADIVREFEIEPEVADVLRQAKDEKWDEDRIGQDQTIQAARDRVEQKARELLGKPKRTPQDPPANDNNEEKRTVEAPGRRTDDVLILDCLFRQRRTRVTVKGRVIRLEDLGPEGRKGGRGKTR